MESYRTDLKDELETVIKRHSQFNARVKKGVAYDTIRRAVFHKELLGHGFKLKDLKLAEEMGWLEAIKVQIEDGSIRNGWAWTKVDLPQRTKFKRFIDRIHRFIRGEYSEYY